MHRLVECGVHVSLDRYGSIAGVSARRDADRDATWCPLRLTRGGEIIDHLLELVDASRKMNVKSTRRAIRHLSARMFRADRSLDLMSNPRTGRATSIAVFSARSASLFAPDSSARGSLDSIQDARRCTIHQFQRKNGKSIAQTPTTRVSRNAARTPRHPPEQKPAIMKRGGTSRALKTVEQGNGPGHLASCVLPAKRRVLLAITI